MNKNSLNIRFVLYPIIPGVIGFMLNPHSPLPWLIIEALTCIALIIYTRRKQPELGKKQLWILAGLFVCGMIASLTVIPIISVIIQGMAV